MIYLRSLSNQHANRIRKNHLCVKIVPIIVPCCTPTAMLTKLGNCPYLKVASATFGSITMFKQQPLLFHVVSKTFITQNYLFVILIIILCFTFLCRYCLAYFKTRDNRGKNNFEKQYCCGNYSVDVY